MQQNKKEPRNSFKVATCRRAAGVYWKATAGLGTQAGNKTKHAFDQMQRLEKKVENNIAMNKCQEVIEKESADTLTLEQQLPRRACKLQTEHTKQWETCYRERCLEQKSVHPSNIKQEKRPSFGASKPTSTTAILNQNYIPSLDRWRHTLEF